MKKLLFVLMVVISGCADPNEKFTGYLVDKVYSPSRMSNEPVKETSYAIFVPVVHHTPPPPPHRVSSSWTIYVANRFETIQKEVDSLTFTTMQCGKKMTINKY